MLLRSRIFLALIALLITVPLLAQQTGAISGKVTATDGSALPGVTVEARSNVLPQPRVTTSDSNGDYRLPALIPGSYTLTFSLSGMQTVTRKAEANLGQNTAANVKLGIQGVAESITVTAQATLVDKTSTALQSGVSQQQIQALPLSQNYGDLQKLVPGVMYTQDTVRGPSAGASGQENTYRFDGANITMPLFGVLSAQPNTNDIAQVNITRGGANAIDFNRAGGFQLDTVSKSGTNKFSGQLGYQFQNPGFIASQTGVQNLFYQRKNTWTTVNVGGPILEDHLFFYASYYRPFATRENTSNLYGTVPQYKDTRNEEFGKLTFTPTESWLLNASYRNSKEVQTTSTFGSLAAPTVGTGYQTSIKLGNLEGSKIINDKSFATFKLSSYKNPGGGRADNFVSGGVNPSTTLGTQLDLANLGTLGSLSIPLPIAGNTAQNAFIAPYIAKYGYMCPQDAAARGLSCTPGQLAGGGLVGFGSLAADNDSFFRHGGQAAYNYTLGSKVTHDLHVGFEKYVEGEDLFRTSNGWGALSIPAGVGAAGTCPATACGSATPAFFVASYSPQGTGQTPIIHSEFHTQSAEFNDAIRWQNWSFNVGVLASDDVLYGQGLAKADNIAGFIKSPGIKYRMHEFSWSQMIQPRLGTTWAYNGTDTLFASFARYNPPANSDARAASWDRNLVQTVNSYFDANGKLIGVDPVASSSGKWWQAGIKPPEYKEILLGTARQLTSAWSAKLYGRARKGDHYIEDTNNNARIAYNPPAGVPQQLYVPNLGTVATPGTIRNAIGSGSSYVIANLDGAFTKYLEATAESDYRSSKGTLHGSYTWSHYYGNFDQDYTSVSTDNDAARFIGSSNIGDGAGRQLWDMKYGDLRGDRRHVVKLYGTYYLPWQGTAGAFFVFQSGQPYQLESVLPYRVLTSSTSDTARYAEPAGSRRTPSQSDLDLNYTQSLPLVRGFRVQLAFDVFNVMNKQTGYNYEERIGTLGIVKVANTATPYAGATVPIPNTITDATLQKQLGNPANYVRSDYAVVAPHPNSYLAPRRFQITARIQF
jgi:hypothetical protein